MNKANQQKEESPREDKRIRDPTDPHTQVSHKNTKRKPIMDMQKPDTDPCKPFVVSIYVNSCMLCSGGLEGLILCVAPECCIPEGKPTE